MTFTKKDLTVFALAFSFCLLLFVLSVKQPIGDFGNYYYGSRVWVNRGNAGILYQDIHLFNEAIRGYGEKNYFENYIPVPPFSLLFYYPFTFLAAAKAKLVFNILSILLFSFSLARLFRYFRVDYKHLLSLFIIAYPLYTNLAQGQAYLLVAAALIEVLIASQQRRYFVAGILIALVFHLKLFPGLILFYFILKKQYRVVLWASVVSGCIFLMNFFSLGGEVLKMYWTAIVPRFFSNEIIDPYYYGHQGIDILFKNLFSYDALKNPHPCIDMPLLPVLLEPVIYGGLIYFTTVLVKKYEAVKAYGLVLFVAMLLSNYVPAYSLVLLLPFIFALRERKDQLIISVVLFFGCNIPLSALDNMPFIIKYERVLLFFFLFIYIVISEQPRIKLLPLLSIMAIIGLASIVRYNDKPANYFLPVKNYTGVYYNIELRNNNVILFRCLGDKDEMDTLAFPEPIVEATTLPSHPLLSDKNERVCNIYWINNKWLLYLSDLRQGIGMYQPRLQQPR